MRAVLDACVLFPTGLRGLLLDVAATGYFTPLWSERILKEWRLAAARVGDDAGVEIALLRADWPDALINIAGVDPDTLSLPDPDDRHVLATAIAGKAPEIITANLRDFPTRILGRYGVSPRHPDTFLLEYAQQNRADMARFVDAQVQLASASLGMSLDTRTFLKRAGLPRLGKFLAI